MPNLPTQKVKQMIAKGLTNEEITRSLEGQGFSLNQISSALNQANLQTGMDLPEYDPMEQEFEEPEQEEQYPAQEYPQQQDYTQYQLPQQQMSYEDIQAIVEEILEEKWKEFMKNTGDINVWKARVSDDLESTKQELIRTQKRLEDLQVAVLGRVKDYNKSVQDISSDMKALENVFGKILEPLTKNIKDLNKVTEELKKSKK
ncbi:MAG: hypothetical protein ABIJ18_05115 [archaeon]